MAVLAAVTDSEPRVLTTHAGQALPAGPFQMMHRSLQAGLREWVTQQTSHPLGYVEQLYTFADRGAAGPGDAVLARHGAISISYLGLTRERDENGSSEGWRNWYRYFPWEDRRAGVPALVDDCLAPALLQWADHAQGAAQVQQRRQRVMITFGLEAQAWNEDLVLQRYELLFEAGLVPEAARRSGTTSRVLVPGEAMLHDHRRILATGIARLRAKIKYRPVVFELMPEAFTLLQLQHTVEALAGRVLHKQNFRRFIEQQDLVEGTGEVATGLGGRPAKLFRFRRDVMLERAVVGSKLPLARGA